MSRNRSAPLRRERGCERGRLTLEIDDARWRLHVRAHGDTCLVSAGEEGHELASVDPYPVHSSADEEETHPRSPMPGRVVAVHVTVGQRVRKGDPLIVLEGMKMEHTVRARRDGLVERIVHGIGEQVERTRRWSTCRGRGG
jgi:3-methylcrotonyl-CoA carboxylase alpha subunit